MFHLRLGRSVRPLVDFLHIFSAETFFSNRSLLHHAGFGGHRTSYPRALSLPSLFDRHRYASRSANVAHRRRLALGGLLLASFLQVCGCNPVKNCDELRGTQLSAMSWGELLEQCSRCLSPGELADLEQREQWERAQSADGRLPDLPLSDQTVDQALHSQPSLSFYEPEESTGQHGSGDALDRDRPGSLATAPMEPETLPWPIPESVYLIYRTTARGDPYAHRRPAAAAFVLSVPGKVHNHFLRFLVTARHVVDPEWAHCAEKNPASITIRLNRREGGIGYETIPLEAGQLRRFFTSPDSTVDLAIIALDRRLIPDLDIYKIVDLPFSLIPTDSELRSLQQDQPIITAGLLTQPPLGPRIYPVLESGALAKTPSDTINIPCGRPATAQSTAQSTAPSPANPLHLWFIDAAIPQGVSGSPVYTSIARGEDPMDAPVLLGIQSVAWPDRGIAGITPSVVLRSLVQSALGSETLATNLSRGPVP